MNIRVVFFMVGMAVSVCGCHYNSIRLPTNRLMECAKKLRAGMSRKTVDAILKPELKINPGPPEMDIYYFTDVFSPTRVYIKMEFDHISGDQTDILLALPSEIVVLEGTHAKKIKISYY
ncbi:hypothetical protein [Prosthecobacter sp.]|uniref:hypothetical protein n=1 Tax=Prosthecobacter sp. TaxID=1965333 RepID=UPI003783BF77